MLFLFFFFFFFFNDTATTEIYTLSLHDALPIYQRALGAQAAGRFKDDGIVPLEVEINEVGDNGAPNRKQLTFRSEEHTSELQSPCNLVCRLLLEKKKKKIHDTHT